MNQYNSDEILNPDFADAPFVQAATNTPTIPVQHMPAVIVDFEAAKATGTMKTWQLIMSEIAVIQRLEVNPAAHEIVRMIDAAKNIKELSDQLVEDMQEHRNKILRDLGVDV